MSKTLWDNGGISRIGGQAGFGLMGGAVRVVIWDIFIKLRRFQANISLFRQMIEKYLADVPDLLSRKGSRRIGIAAAMLLFAAGIAGCATLKSTLRYRLTVVVDTPQGIRTGSSVVEVQSALSPAFPGPEAGGFRFQVRGEATPVELGNGKYLFAVFAWASPPERTFTMLTVPFRDQLPPRSTDPSAANKSFAEMFRALADARGVREVEPVDYPVIATFADVTKPYSIRFVPAPELSTILPGYRVIRMTIEITDAPVSHKILRILPWLKRGDLGFLNQEVKRNPSKPFPYYQTLQNDGFIKGINFLRNENLYKHKD